MWLVLILLVVPFLITRFVTPKIAQLFLSTGITCTNFLDRRIPTATGIVVVFSCAVGYILAAWAHEDIQMQIFVFLFVLLGMSMLGLIDDFIGVREVTGLKGHLALLFKGKLTTGNIKALGGGLLALGFSLFFSKTFMILILNALLVVLFTNALNLMDLRPGRAGKVFILINTLLLIFSLVFIKQQTLLLMFIPILGSLLAFLPYDLSGEVMLGDTGSNALGIILGMLSVLVLPTLPKIITVILLVILHIYTEKYSLTETISKIGFLRYIDEWGRVK